MIVTVIEYGGESKQIECESFEFRCNHVTNWIQFRKSDGTKEMIRDVCVIKTGKERINDQRLQRKNNPRVHH